jgi:hypothetical protein
MVLCKQVAYQKRAFLEIDSEISNDLNAGETISRQGGKTISRI